MTYKSKRRGQERIASIASPAARNDTQAESCGDVYIDIAEAQGHARSAMTRKIVKHGRLRTYLTIAGSCAKHHDTQEQRDVSGNELL